MMGALLLGACNGLKLFHSPDDKAITTDIQAKLFGDPVLKTRDIRVVSQNGVVTLSGTVDTELEKSAVEHLASQQEGVKNVLNTLSVILPPAPPSPESAKPLARVMPAEAPPHEAAPEEPRHIRSAAPAASDQEKPADDLQADSNSVPPEPAATGNPSDNPPQAPASAPTLPAVVYPSPAAAPPAAPAPAAPASPPPAPQPAPKPQPQITIPAGTVVTIRMIDNIDSSRNKPGEEFAATVDSPVVVNDQVVVPRGVDARIRLVDAQSAGHIEGQSDLKLQLIAVTVNGVSYPTSSGYYEQHGASRGTRSAETIGGGAVLGALIGGILGHGKGAAIGSVAGAGAGTAVQVSTEGQQVKVPSETKLDFTLKDPLTIPLGSNS